MLVNFYQIAETYDRLIEITIPISQDTLKWMNKLIDVTVIQIRIGVVVVFLNVVAFLADVHILNVFAVKRNTMKKKQPNKILKMMNIETLNFR